MKFKMIAMAMFLGLAGCASFPGEEVAETQLPSMVNYQERPGVFGDFNFYRGEAGSAGAVEVPQGRDQLKPQLEAVLRDSGMFSRYTLDQFQKQPGDYTLKLNVYNSGSTGAAMLSGMITGFTLGIIPGSGKDEYTMTLQVIDGQGQLVKVGENHDSVRTWMGWVFLPMMAHTPADAINDSFRRQLMALLKQMLDKQMLKYAQGRSLLLRG